MAQKLMELLALQPEPRKSLVMKMMEGPVGNTYFTAPASSRAEFHSCYPGGLLVHSMNVIQNLNRLAKSLCPGQYEDNTLIFVGAFHDLGKVGDGENEYYLPNSSDWHVKKGMLYETNKDCEIAATEDRTLYLLQRYEIKLNSEEYLAIKLSDGQYCQSNDKYKMKEPLLALLLHWADRCACEIEKLKD